MCGGHTLHYGIFSSIHGFAWGFPVHYGIFSNMHGFAQGFPVHYGIFSSIHGFAWGFPGDSVVNNLTALQETWVRALDHPATGLGGQGMAKSTSFS